MGQSSSSSVVYRDKTRRRRLSYQGSFRGSKLKKPIISPPFNLVPFSEIESELMNINIATEEQLMTLPGITRKMANEIVKHRQIIGPCKKIEDLLLIPGFDSEIVKLLKPEICTGTGQEFEPITRASSCQLIKLNSPFEYETFKLLLSKFSLNNSFKSFRKVFNTTT